MPNNTISGSFPTEIRLSAGGFLEAMIYKFKIELCRPVGAFHLINNLGQLVYHYLFYIVG